MIWVTAEDVVAIHSRIIQVSGGIDGLRDRAGLRTPLCKISSTGEIEQRFRLN